MSTARIGSWPRAASPLVPRRLGSRGLTLVELLVSISLGSILIGVAIFVWIQSSNIFTTTVNRLETYQRLRTVLDMMERDLANTNRTTAMEFYEPGDQESALTLADGQVFRAPRDTQDPLYDADTGTWASEFNLPTAFPPLHPTTNKDYLFAPTIVSPEPYTIGAGYTDDRSYWRDEIYVRSYVSIRGVNRPALVHYRLVQVDDGRSVLRRRVWYLNQNYELIPPGEPEATDRVSIMSAGIADLKVGFFFKYSPISGNGAWYHVGDYGGGYSGDPDDPLSKDRHDQLAKLDQDRGFRDSSELFGDGQFGSLNAVSFFYEGHGRIEQPLSGPALFRSLSAGTALDLQTLTAESDLAHYDGFDFPGVRSGDSFYIYDAVDDDGAKAEGAEREAGQHFPPQVLTVDEVYSFSDRDNPAATPPWHAVKFREPINFYRLNNVWLGDEGGAVWGGPTDDGDNLEITAAALGSPGGARYKGGPPRVLSASFNVKYRVGFLPAALLIRLSCDDRYNRRVLPMERVIRLLQQ